MPVQVWSRFKVFRLILVRDSHRGGSGGGDGGEAMTLKRLQAAANQHPPENTSSIAQSKLRIQPHSTAPIPAHHTAACIHDARPRKCHPRDSPLMDPALAARRPCRLHPPAVPQHLRGPCHVQLRQPLQGPGQLHQDPVVWRL